MLIPKKENKNVEFKSKLSINFHLKNEERKQHLASQMKNLLESGNGYAIYYIGVDDNGNPIKINEFELQETINVLKVIALENNAEIYKIENFEVNGKKIAKVVIKTKEIKPKENIIVGLAGHVHHGKSTLVATLITNKKDNGKNWLYLNVLPHEIERNLTADLHFAFLAFKNGVPIFFQNPLNKEEQKAIFEKADKIVSFVDNVGHEAWLRTTLRGLMSNDLDYAILTIAADDGITNITKEHLGILLALNIPFIITITKIDKVKKEKVEKVIEEVEDLLKNFGKLPISIQNENEIYNIIDKIDFVVPIVKTSSFKLEGYEILRKLLFLLPKRKYEENKPFLMFIDKVYNIKGVGIVVSGTVKQGKLKPNSKLLIGPLKDGSFKEVIAKSIQMFHSDLQEAKAGLIVGIALKGIKKEEIKRGMALFENGVDYKVAKSFEAEIFVFNHPTRITSGYEAVVHVNSISEVAKFKLIDKEYVKAKESCKAILTFKYHKHLLKEGDNFVFREGRTKGVGKILKILN